MYAVINDAIFDVANFSMGIVTLKNVKLNQTRVKDIRWETLNKLKKQKIWKSFMRMILKFCAAFGIIKIVMKQNFHPPQPTSCSVLILLMIAPNLSRPVAALSLISVTWQKAVIHANSIEAVQKQSCNNLSTYAILKKGVDES